MMNISTLLVAAATVSLSVAACKTNKNSNVLTAEQTVAVPTFNADSAYHYIKAQVDFGPRVPNTAAHRACAQYLTDKLTQFGADVKQQKVDLTRYDGAILKACNIIGSYNLDTKKRIALFAHWDSRPWSDHDPDPTKHHTPVIGANDGASGVGVLLEIARQLQSAAPALGIDIILFDAEDGGVPQFETHVNNTDNYWCLGSQYWARYPHTQGYNARFGILLDMVGGKGAQFLREAYSEEYAKDINKKVWRAARQLGYGQSFIDRSTGAVTDDHYFVNTIARIPTIDIIPTPADPNVSFFEHWHTTTDNMDNIDRATLQAVGQTVLQVIYTEK